MADRRTPEERLAFLEARMSGIEDWMKSIAGNVDVLARAANMGRGIVWFLITIGSFALMLWGAIIATLNYWRH